MRNQWGEGGGSVMLLRHFLEETVIVDDDN
jgi:hypothetical protein